MTGQKGVCLWLTGRSGAGKSTVTKALLPLLDRHGRTVTVLDVVPYLAKHWFERSSEGKLLRKAFVASEIARHGGVAICVTVSARRETREAIRNLVGEERFVEVYVDSPAEVCRERKRRRNRRPPGLKRANNFVRRLSSRLRFRPDVSYETPVSPEIVIDSHNQTPEAGAAAIVQYLAYRGFLDGNGSRNGAAVNSATIGRETRSHLVRETVLPLR
jgi:sulfate adenylyltransferase